jgi:hypothetical protein
MCASPTAADSLCELLNIQSIAKEEKSHDPWERAVDFATLI